MGENIYKRNRNSFSLLDKYVLLFWNRIYIIVRDLRQCVEFYQIYGDVYNKKEGPHDLDGIGIEAWFLDTRQEVKYIRIKRIVIIRIKKKKKKLYISERQWNERKATVLEYLKLFF